MGFSSHLSDLKVRNKRNARYLKKGSYFRLKNIFLEASAREGVDLKSANTDQLRQVKEKIRQQKKENKRQKLKAIIGSITLGILIFYLVGQLIQFTFFS